MHITFLSSNGISSFACVLTFAANKVNLHCSLDLHPVHFSNGLTKYGLLSFLMKMEYMFRHLACLFLYSCIQFLGLPLKDFT